MGIADLTNVIGETRASLNGTRERHAHLEALLLLWEDWVALQEAEAGLASLVNRVEEFPEEGLPRLTTMEQDIRSRQERSRPRQEEALTRAGEASASMISQWKADAQSLHLPVGTSPRTAGSQAVGTRVYASRRRSCAAKS